MPAKRKLTPVLQSAEFAAAAIRKYPRTPPAQTAQHILTDNRDELIVYCSAR
jgi:hypothetical protein